MGVVANPDFDHRWLGANIPIKKAISPCAALRCAVLLGRLEEERDSTRNIEDKRAHHRSGNDINSSSDCIAHGESRGQLD